MIKDTKALAETRVLFWLKPTTKLIVKNGLKPIPIEFMQKTKFVLLQGLFPDLVGILKVQHTYKVKRNLAGSTKS